MNPKNLVRLLALAVLAAGALWLCAPAEAAPKATVSFYTNPKGAEVYLDNVRLGLSPITFWTVTPGQHVVRFGKPGYRTTQFWFTARAGQKLNLRRTLYR